MTQETQTQNAEKPTTVENAGVNTERLLEMQRKFRKENQDAVINPASESNISNQDAKGREERMRAAYTVYSGECAKAGSIGELVSVYEKYVAQTQNGGNIYVRANGQGTLINPETVLNALRSVENETYPPTDLEHVTIGYDGALSDAYRRIALEK